MQTVSQAVFALALAALLVHEMDAVRHREWKMFVVLKDMEEEKARRVFTLLHLPLYAALLWILLSGHRVVGYVVTDVFLAGHLLVHGLFRRHPANSLNGKLSRGLILAAGLLGILHLALLALG